MTGNLFKTLSERLCISIEDLLDASMSEQHERSDEIRLCIQKCSGTSEDVRSQGSASLMNRVLQGATGPV